MHVSSDEYDKFGPWIDEVRGPSDVPRLFRTRSIAFDSAVGVFKVPRNIARRDADPTMDLYDHLIILEAEALTVLSRADAAFLEQKLPYRDLAMLHDSVDLLDGRFEALGSGGQSLSFSYNGSSRRAVLALMDRVRAQIPRSTESLTAIEARPELTLGSLGRDSNGLVAAYLDLTTREPDVRLLAAHGTQPLTRKRGPVSRAMDVLRPQTLHGLVLCTNGCDLIVISRRGWTHDRKRPTVSEALRIVPIDAISRVTIAPDVNFASIAEATIHLHGAHAKLVIPDDSEALTALTAL